MDYICSPIWDLERETEAGVLVERAVSLQILLCEPWRQRSGRVHKIHDFLALRCYGNLAFREEDIDVPHHRLGIVPAEVRLCSPWFPPSFDVEAFGERQHLFEAGRGVRNAKSHQTLDAIRVLNGEMISWKGSEIFAN